MARIINLNELLPEDIIFEYNGEEYAVPGDLSVEDVFRLYDLFSRTKEELDEGSQGVGQRHVTALQEELLRMFQIRQPELKRLPFGIRGTAVVISHILEQLNPPEDETEGEQSLPPTSRRSSRTPRSKTSASTKRRPSRGSRR